MQVSYKLFGKEANLIADHVLGEGKARETDINTKVHFNVRSVEGRTVVEVSFEV